jgi:hypothetical protein
MIKDLVGKIRNELITAFAETKNWFDGDNSLLDYIPQNGGWTIRQVLEHISLTNHYLLILIRKGTYRAIENARKTDYNDLLAGYDLDWEKLDAIGKHGSFQWNRPVHMEPTGVITSDEVKIKLDDQLKECLDYLGQIPNGEGILYKTMMSVNGLGKIDVYHYILFLGQHTRRHITQMESIKIEFNNRK